jgi:ribonuclease J
MDKVLKKYKDDILFLALGGAGEIGMNLNLYRYQGKWLMVDLGAGFADDYYPGVDVIIPDIEFIREHKDDLVGLVLTHAHEDHLGAVGYLIDELRCPIYANKFTANFLKNKIADLCPDYKPTIYVIEEDSDFSVGPFDLKFVSLTHSTLEMQAVYIKTKIGNIFHTGDWKFDDNPMIGKNYSVNQLKKIGDEGVLAFVGDSTNVFNKTASGSEGDLVESIFEIVNSCKKMVMVTTFASNVARLSTLIRIGQRAGRKICFVGRSLWRILAAAQESGYLLDIPEIYEDRDIIKFPRDKIMLITTGCQGEPLAATSKIASENHPIIKLSKGDAVIFSSKIIPGNEKKIFRLFNSLVRIGAEVFTEKDHFVHVSGHPSAVELEKMYGYIKPKISIPVHGELVHIHEHARLAKSFGVEHTIQIENGDLVRIYPEGVELVAKVKSGYIAVDGGTLIASDSKVMRMRRKMIREGIVLVYLVLNRSGNFVVHPKIVAPGLMDVSSDKDLMDDIQKELVATISGQFHQVGKNKKLQEHIENLARQVIRRNIKFYMDKNPVIDVHIDFV